nr:MFS transporter [Desulfitobacterium hafniense]
FSLLMGLSIKSIAFEKRATAMGFFQAVYGLGMFLGPMLVGFFSDSIGLDSSFFALTVVGAAGALISVLAIREVKVTTESNK